MGLKPAWLNLWLQWSETLVGLANWIVSSWRDTLPYRAILFLLLRLKYIHSHAHTVDSILFFIFYLCFRSSVQDRANDTYINQTSVCVKENKGSNLLIVNPRLADLNDSFLTACVQWGAEAQQLSQVTSAPNYSCEGVVHEASHSCEHTVGMCTTVFALYTACHV